VTLQSTKNAIRRLADGVHLFTHILNDSYSPSNWHCRQSTGITPFGQICEVLKVVSEASLKKNWLNRAILTYAGPDTATFKFQGRATDTLNLLWRLKHELVLTARIGCFYLSAILTSIRFQNILQPEIQQEDF